MNGMTRAAAEEEFYWYMRQIPWSRYYEDEDEDEDEDEGEGDEDDGAG
jgi:hypothetical protein